jgi:hypothetical protein
MHDFSRHGHATMSLKCRCLHALKVIHASIEVGNIYLDTDPCESLLFLLSLLHELYESCGGILFEGCLYSLVVIPPVFSGGTGGPVFFGRILQCCPCDLFQTVWVEYVEATEL